MRTTRFIRIQKRALLGLRKSFTSPKCPLAIEFSTKVSKSVDFIWLNFRKVFWKAVRFCEELGGEWSLAIFTIYDYYGGRFAELFNDPCATQSRYWIRQYNNFTVRAKNGRHLTRFNVECPSWAVEKSPNRKSKHKISYSKCTEKGFGVICSKSRPRTKVRIKMTFNYL